MMRSFELTLPLTASWYNLLTQLLAEAAAIPTDGYFPNPCTTVDIIAKTGTFTIADSNHAGPAGQTLYHRAIGRNVIDLGEYRIKGSQDSTVVDVIIAAT